MKALIIGGTGTISTAVCRLLSQQGWDLTVLNRGRTRQSQTGNIRQLIGDMTDEQAIGELLADSWFDVVANFIVFKPEQVERDLRLFNGRCGQYIFISSASAYQKPPVEPVISESTPLANPYWSYSQAKIACEDRLMQAFREDHFPITIVRPSHTYAEWSVPLSIHGAKGSWQTLQRMIDGKPVVVHGDGTSLWTLTHSDDFAFAFTGLMGNIHAVGQAVHITSDEVLSWNQIYQAIGQALAVSPRLVHISTDELIAAKPDLLGPLLGDKAHCAIFDNQKIKHLVPGFAAVIRFDQGIRRSIEHYINNPELQKPDPDWDAFLDHICKDRPVV